MARTGRPKELRTYDRTIRVRVRTEDEELIKSAAAIAGRRRGGGDMSSWVREILVTAARRELAKDGGP